MEKSKELSDPNSCLNRAQDDEPIFVLKSTDEIAPSIVRLWAKAYLGEKNRQPGGATDKQLRKYDEALDLSRRMEIWSERQKKKLESGS